MTILLIVLALLSACTGSPAAPAGGDAAAEDAVELRVWTHQNDAFNDGLEVLADAYMAENPDVAISFETFDYDTYIQTLQTALPAGTEADILQMFGSWVCSYAEGGNLAAVPEEVISLADAEAAIFAAQLAGYVCDGSLYGVPQEFNIEYGASAGQHGHRRRGWADRHHRRLGGLGCLYRRRHSSWLPSRTAS